MGDAERLEAASGVPDSWYNNAYAEGSPYRGFLRQRNDEWAKSVAEAHRLHVTGRLLANRALRRVSDGQTIRVRAK